MEYNEYKFELVIIYRRPRVSGPVSPGAEEEEEEDRQPWTSLLDVLCSDKRCKTVLLNKQYRAVLFCKQYKIFLFFKHSTKLFFLLLKGCTKLWRLKTVDITMVAVQSHSCGLSTVWLCASTSLFKTQNPHSRWCHHYYLLQSNCKCVLFQNTNMYTTFHVLVWSRNAALEMHSEENTSHQSLYWSISKCGTTMICSPELIVLPRRRSYRLKRATVLLAFPKRRCRSKQRVRAWDKNTW